jgi:uncharacterized membrane protein
MNWMGRRMLLQAIDQEKVERAIREAEQKSSGEIRVSVAPFFWGDIDRAARMAFDRLHMSATRRRNAVLFFVVPSRRRFVVLGDTGIHERVGQAFWDYVASVMSEDFRAHRFTEGLLHGIEAVGNELGAHFPREAGDVDELPDEVHVGRP